MLYLRIFVFCLFLTVLVLITYAMISGIRSARLLTKDANRHIGVGIWTGIVTVLAILFTEIMVRINGGIMSKRLFEVHLPFASLFLLTLIAELVIGYLKIKADREFRPVPKLRKAHQVLGKICYAIYVITFITGTILLYLLKPLPHPL